MNPQNAIIGDMEPTALPQMPDTQQEEALLELKKKAKYSRSKEFAELKENMETRIKFYQAYLPDGRPIATASKEDVEIMWRVANLVIAELQQVIDGYQTAEELLKEADET